MCHRRNKTGQTHCAERALSGRVWLRPVNQYMLLMNG